MENIRYGKLDATDEEVYKAAKLAHADGFIRMLPKGYDTYLTGDGEELSPGPETAAVHSQSGHCGSACVDPG